jgi:AraC family transcriptional regulator
MRTHNYEARIQRVLRYIHDHPAEDLSLDVLADVAAMSRFHWSRVWRGVMGETVTGTVRRLRMHFAAMRLVHEDCPIAQIAASVGYPDKASFARAFASEFGCTAKSYRQAGKPPVFVQTSIGETTMFKVEMTNLPPLRLMGLWHKGPYSEISKAFEALNATMAARNLWPQTRGMYGAYFDDKDSVPEADLRSFAAFDAAPDLDLPEGLEQFETPATRAAVLNFDGPYSGLQEAYNYLYGVWLPNSGEEPAPYPAIEQYLNTPADASPGDLKTRIYLPLAA